MKIAWMVIAIVMTFAIGTSVYAYDLPIDITAIARQDTPMGRVTHRIGAHLFTSDAQRINDAMANDILQRQDTVGDLFLYKAYRSTTPLQYGLLTAASDMNLFNQPVNFTRFHVADERFEIPNWVFIVTLSVCAAAGFLFALRSISNKRSKQERVY